MRRLAALAWAGPNTALGLALGLLMWLGGARARVVRGVLEFSGGRLGRLVVAPAARIPFRAMTLGHVILAVDASHLAAAREHERVHVQQYEAWGPLFLPAYVASSLWQLLRGRRCYRDNWFEREAYGACGNLASVRPVERHDPPAREEGNRP
jgi:hypothetical protein